MGNIWLNIPKEPWDSGYQGTDYGGVTIYT